MIDDKLVEKFQDYNIFIGDVIRTPKVKKVSKGEQQYIFLNKYYGHLRTLPHCIHNIVFVSTNYESIGMYIYVIHN